MIAEFFVIASRPRSGTHLLSTTLDALADVTCYKEVFNPEQLAREPANRTIDDMWDQSFPPRDWLARCIFKASKDSKAFGLCVHRYQIEEMENVRSALKLLRPRIILLRREDLLAQYASKLIARERKGWWSAKEDRRKQSLRTLKVEPQQFLEFCRSTRASENKDRKLWGQRPIFELTYEGLVGDYDRNMELAACFVGCNHKPEGGFAAATAKQEGRTMREVVENYPALAAACGGTNFEYLFTERDRLEGGIVEV